MCFCRRRHAPRLSHHAGVGPLSCCCLVLSPAPAPSGSPVAPLRCITFESQARRTVTAGRVTPYSLQDGIGGNPQRRKARYRCLGIWPIDRADWTVLRSFYFFLESCCARSQSLTVLYYFPSSCWGCMCCYVPRLLGTQAPGKLGPQGSQSITWALK